MLHIVRKILLDSGRELKPNLHVGTGQLHAQSELLSQRGT